MVKEKHFLNEMNWKEAEEAFKKTTVAVLPVGCLHAHGDALLGIDNITIEEISKRIAVKTNAILCPTIPYGPAAALMDFPGTIHVNREILRDMLLDICRSLNKWGIRKIIFLNGHGGNDVTIRDVGSKLREERGMIGVLVDWWNLIMELDSKFKDKPSYITEPAISAAMGLLDIMKARVRTWKEETFLGNKFSGEGYTFKFRKGSIVIVGLTGKEVTKPPEEGEILGPKASADVGREILDVIANYIVDLIKEFEKIEVPSM